MVTTTSGYKDSYQSLLRRRFTKVDFNCRRAKVLNIPDLLSHDEIAVRLANTIAFIFNSTCNRTDTDTQVTSYDTLKQATTPRIETSIIDTILQMEQQTPASIKFDFTFRWIDSTSRFYAELEASKGMKREINRLYNKKIASNIGFYQYEQSVMGLNESLRLMV